MLSEVLSPRSDASAILSLHSAKLLVALLIVGCFFWSVGFCFGPWARGAPKAQGEKMGRRHRQHRHTVGQPPHGTMHDMLPTTV